MNINDFLEETRHAFLSEPGKLFVGRPHIECADGFTMSVQAGEYIYCSPRSNHGPYTEVEIGHPSEREESLMPYAKDETVPTDTVYAYVPIAIVETIIACHGGMKN